jgi:hypothetical protein
MTSSRTRNLPKEWLFRRELSVPGPGSHLRNDFPSGHKFMDAESIGGKVTANVAVRGNTVQYIR